MTKKKRTLKQIEGMQAKAVRFQHSLFNFDAAFRIEELTLEQYAMWRNIEIVDKPVQKRKRQKKEKSIESTPPTRFHSVVVTEQMPGEKPVVTSRRVVKEWIVPIEQTSTKKSPKRKT
jgi:hypothetical protein